MAIGIYNQKCLWQKKASTVDDKLNEIEEVEPIELNCGKTVERIRVRDENGERFVYKSVYRFEDTRVKEGDIIDGFIVTSTNAGIGINVELLSHKVVVDNA